MLDSRSIYLCAHSEESSYEDYKILCSKCLTETSPNIRYLKKDKLSYVSVCTECGYFDIKTYLSKNKSVKALSAIHFSDKDFCSPSGELVLGIPLSEEFNTLSKQYMNWLTGTYLSLYVCSVKSLINLLVFYCEPDDYEGCRTELQDIVKNLIQDVCVDRVDLLENTPKSDLKDKPK